VTCAVGSGDTEPLSIMVRALENDSPKIKLQNATVVTSGYAFWLVVNERYGCNSYGVFGLASASTMSNPCASILLRR